jgi:AraC-like DNA-binding protein
MSGVRYDIKGQDIGLPLVFSMGFHNYNYSVGLDRHAHAEGPEITYVMKGFAEWKLGNGEVLQQPGRTLAVMPRDVEHHGAGEVITPCWLFWYILDLRDRESAMKNTPFTTEEMNLIIDVFFVNSVRIVPASVNIERHFSALLEIIRRPAPNIFHNAEMRLVLCQIILDTAIELKNDMTLTDAPLASRAREYMKVNMTSNISVDDIAAACGLSESQFARRFKRETGVTPADCLQRMRIEEACRRLRQTDKSITDITFELGFSSSQYFSTAFRRYVGITPYKYRKSR